MSRPVTRSQTKVEPKVPDQREVTLPLGRPKRKPSTSNSASSSSTVKFGHSSVSSSLPTRANTNDTRPRKMKREQVKASTSGETEFLPSRKKTKRNDHDDDVNDTNRENLDLDYTDMLPPEVWAMVFGELRDPLDFHALINSSATWRKLLKNQRTKFLFSLVLPILLNNGVLDSNKYGDVQPQVDTERGRGWVWRRPAPIKHMTIYPDSMVLKHWDEPPEKFNATKNVKFKHYRTVCKTWDRGILDYIQRYYRHAFLSSMKMSAEMEAVNDKFENDDPRMNDTYDYMSEIECHVNAENYVFVTPLKIDTFLDKFNSGYQQFARNPILTGCVVISDSHLWEIEPEPEPINFNDALGRPQPPRPIENDHGAIFLETSKILLIHYGENIHYLTLELGHFCSSTSFEFQSDVCNLLTHVPNLKGLILKYKADDEAWSDYLQKPEVQAARYDDDFPKLANLQFLEVYNVPGVIFDSIVSKASSLRKVSIQLMQQSKASYGDYFHSIPRFGEGPQMPLSMFNMNIRSRKDLVNLESSLRNGNSLKIETLRIRFYQYMKGFHDDDSRDWQTYCKRERPFEFGYREGWNNEFDGGIFDYDNYWDWHPDHDITDCFYVPKNDHVATSESDDWPEWSRLFRVVELLGAESVLKLSIRLPVAVQRGDSQGILAECPDLRLNLSKLKTLVIQIPNTTSIDFLLGMKDTLEEATLILPNFTRVMSRKHRLKEQIKFNGRFHKMNSSNIWTEMSKLKKLTLRVVKKVKWAPASAYLKEYNYERPFIS